MLLVCDKLQPVLSAVDPGLQCKPLTPSCMQQFMQRNVCCSCHFSPLTCFVVSVLQLFQLQTALRDANVAIYGGERSSKYLSLPKAPSPRHEYGTAALTLELVESMDDAIDHLHANGSGHTECIVTGKL